MNLDLLFPLLRGPNNHPTVLSGSIGIKSVTSRYRGKIAIGFVLILLLAGLPLLNLVFPSLAFGGTGNLGTSSNQGFQSNAINLPPPDLKAAFIGDQSLSSNAEAVLNLIKTEGADLVIHSGDLAYSSNIEAWDQMISDVLGPSFPYFMSVGNHDSGDWEEYQQKFSERLNLIPDAICTSAPGQLGINSICTYKGLSIALSGVGTKGSGHETYIQQAFANDDHIWRICSWHKNMKKMQVGGKSDSTGWGVYEACLQAGAIVSTGHEHSYSRTYLMSSFENQIIASTSSTLELEEGKLRCIVLYLQRERNARSCRLLF
ncbi:MAG: metallophosphoesterase [Chloroflexi bacterium]|nr:metallophosphoesterase [Chloroflexota bacterium]